ncbi:MAG: hypothetical protein ACMUIG_03355 [Thermoplasmatota archaeon]
MRLRGALAALFIIQLMIFVPVKMDDAGGDTTVPSIVEGTTFTWSYDFRSADGQTTRSGEMTAGVSQASWKGLDCYMLSGSIAGEYSTTEGSGDETGTFTEFYRTQDLALLDTSQEIQYTISGYDILNMTDVSYTPGYEWIRFPLSYTPAQWSVDGQKIQTSWEVHIDGDPSYSGSSEEIEDITFFIINIGSAESVTVEAGTFDTYHIREVWSDDPDGKTVDTYYSDDVDWWVKKDVWIDGDTEKIQLRHWELVEWGSNRPPSSEPIPDIVMDEDTEDSSIVLDDVFSDPDGDELTYGIEDNGSLPVAISSGRVIISPGENEFGSWSFNVTARDPIYPPIRRQVNVTVLPVNDPPVLSDPQFHPGIGDPDTEFSFTIRISDVEGDAPSSPLLHIGSLTKALSEIPGSAEDGILLGWTGTLPIGSHEHYYTIDGIRYPETGAITGPVVSSDAVPELSDGNVNPDFGGLDTIFTFSVIWEFEDGDEPDQVIMVLDGFDHMMERSGGDPITGSTYSLTTALPEGDHSHHYEAVLGVDTFRYPISEITGPSVLVPRITDHGARESDEGIAFYCIVEYGLDVEPDDVVLVISGTEYPVTSEEGSMLTGLNLSTVIELDPGTYEYTFKLTFGTRSYSADGSVDVDDPVITDDDSDDGPDDGNGDDGSSDDGSMDTYLIAAVMISGAVIVVAVILILGRKPKGPSAESWDEEEDLEAEEGQSSMVRGI